MDKTGVIYMSIHFHSCITSQNRLENERATPKDSKITLLGLDAKGNKNRKIRKEHPVIFFTYLSRKIRVIQIGPPEVLGWGCSSRVDTIMCPYL